MLPIKQKVVKPPINHINALAAAMEAPKGKGGGARLRYASATAA